MRLALTAGVQSRPKEEKWQKLSRLAQAIERKLSRLSYRASVISENTRFTIRLFITGFFF